jgi:hypothetical protein
MSYLYFFLILGFTIKLLWISCTEYYPTMDAFVYLTNARKIASLIFPDYYWPIGYSVLLAPLTIFNNLIILKLANVITSTLTVFYSYKFLFFLKKIENTLYYYFY